jgi:C1A family cysteine protease
MYKYKAIESLTLRAEKRKALKVAIDNSVDIPSSSSLRDKVKQVYDQGQLGSCTANAFCGAYRILEADDFEPSRLFFYYYERLLELPPGEHKVTDSGGDVVDGETYVEKFGVCSESSWPYNIEKANNRPTKKCRVEALQHKITSHGVIDASAVKATIAQGRPVLLAIKVYQSFETPIDGKIPMPDPSKEQLLGGHELVIVGYDDSQSTYTVLNSWGTSWGDGGFCYVPYDYINNPDLCVELSVFAI